MANPRGAQREKLNSGVSRSAAARSAVLLKNDGVLPFKRMSTVAVFGIGQIYTFKGGTGSGDVNNHRTVSILEGLSACPELIVDEKLAGKYRLWAVGHPSETVERDMRLMAFSNSEMPLESYEIDEAAERCDGAIIVISRISGEFLDRSQAKGDYELQDEEARLIENVTAAFEKTAVILNTAGVIDTKLINQRAGAVLYLSLPGQEAGNALADIITGKVNPSGKLAATWAENYPDYGSSANFGTARKNGNVTAKSNFGLPAVPAEQTCVKYEDDIFVGYRWFDAFNVTPAYPFGFGLSYTDFEISESRVTYSMGAVTVTATVTNSGEKYSGREVVQVYVSAPEGELEKPCMELRGFKKTGDIAPGGSETVTVVFPITSLASYSERRGAWILEKGVYYIRVGNSSRNTFIAGALRLDETVETLKTASLMGTPPEDFRPVSREGVTPAAGESEETEKAQAAKLAITVYGRYIERKTAKYPSPKFPDPLPECGEAVTTAEVKGGIKTPEQLAARMSVEELSRLCCGVGTDLSGLPDNGGATVGSACTIPVHGAAGATAAFPQYGIKQLILADGPAGIRITREVPEQEGRPGYRQNCTAFPVGTLLASSWDLELIEEVGEAVALEMEEFGVDLWLAPGMNIQRNPLCGRNFEYFSEDPLVSGLCAAAITRGVQKHGRGVTVKHFAGNNQEDQRTNMTDYVSQRALREIYLKGFETAVKNAQPLAIMTSYNDINGVPSADNFDLCTAIARDEWGFDGLIMTDWGGGVSTPALSIFAGNDLIEPGGESDAAELAKAVEDGVPVRSQGEARPEAAVTKAMLQQCALRILKVVMKLK